MAEIPVRGRGEDEADISAREIVTVRQFNVPPADLFAAFSQAAALQSWWGPAGFTNIFDEFDFRPGGAWRFRMIGPDAREHSNESYFVEIVAPERIVFHHRGPPHEYWATFQFARQEGGTLLTWRMLHVSSTDCARLRPLIQPANEQNMDRLEEFFAVRQSSMSSG